MFRLLKLTPPNGWNAVAWELAIVTLGVLIALGAQQAVQAVNDRENVAQLRSAFKGELADVRARWEHMRAQDRCTLQRIAALERWVATAPADAVLRDAYGVFLWNMHSEAWDIATTSPAAAHIPLEERLAYASLYGAVDNWREYLAEERTNINALRALFATANEPDNRPEIRVRLAHARNFVDRRQKNYPFLFTRFDALGIAADPSKLTMRFDVQSLCRPLSA